MVSHVQCRNTGKRYSSTVSGIRRLRGPDRRKEDRRQDVTMPDYEGLLEH